MMTPGVLETVGLARRARRGASGARRTRRPIRGGRRPGRLRAILESPRAKRVPALDKGRAVLRVRDPPHTSGWAVFFPAARLPLAACFLIEVFDRVLGR